MKTLILIFSLFLLTHCKDRSFNASEVQDNRAGNDSVFPEKNNNDDVMQGIIGLTEYDLGVKLISGTHNVDTKVGVTASDAEFVKNVDQSIVTARERYAALQKYANASKGTRVISGLRILAGTVLIVDASARLYVWNSLDKNPTYSPVLTYIAHVAKTKVTSIPQEKTIYPSEVFDEPSKAPGTQLMIASVEEAAGYALVMPMHKQAIKAAEDALEQAKKLGVSKRSPLREERVAAAEEQLALTRAEALNAVTKTGKYGKAIQGLRRIGGALLILDGAGRGYIWWQMDKNPTFSPLATMLMHASQMGYQDFKKVISEEAQDVKNKYLDRYLSK